MLYHPLKVGLLQFFLLNQHWHLHGILCHIMAQVLHVPFRHTMRKNWATSSYPSLFYPSFCAPVIPLEKRICLLYRIGDQIQPPPCLTSSSSLKAFSQQFLKSLLHKELIFISILHITVIQKSRIINYLQLSSFIFVSFP